MEFLTGIVDRLKEAGIRSSIFVGADAEQIKAAAKAGADRIELYTKPYVDNYAKDRDAAVAPFVEASQAAHNVGLGVNAGHDLNLENLRFFYQSLPYLNEVSIGHAIISDALYMGIEATVKAYRECLKED
jgi:pyridoxine 5-phosphate synthase